MTKLVWARYMDQLRWWPASGRHLLAQFDSESVVVYQAYGLAIGEFAVKHGHLGGAFSLGRMSWIKPSFLWMMHRSAWGSRPGQEMPLAVRLRRSAFNEILERAVLAHGGESEKADATSRREIIIQWDPDHDPSGKPVERRTIQIGLRGDALRSYARDWIVEIENLSDLVAERRREVFAGDFDQLTTPDELEYPVENPRTAAKLGLSQR